MAWSTPYIEDILKPAIIEWHKKKNEGRDEVVKQTCKELYAKQAANPTKLNPLKDAAGLAGVSLTARYFEWDRIADEHIASFVVVQK